MADQNTPAVGEHIERSAWLAKRKEHLTGTDIPAILGKHPWRTAADVQADKLGVAPETEDKPVFKRGRMLEPVAAALYTEETGRQLRRIPFRAHPNHPLIGASVDRQILAGPDHETGPAEFKVLGLRSFEDVRKGGLPPYMILQGQVEAWVWGYSYTGYGILHPDSFRLLTFDVDAKPDLMEDITGYAYEWWARHIVNRDPVEVAAPPPPVELPEVEGEVVQRTDADFQARVAQLTEAKELRRHAEEIEREARDALLALLGEERGAFEGGGARVYVKDAPGRVTLDTKKLRGYGPLDPFAVSRWIQHQAPHTLLDLPFEELRLDFSAFERRGSTYTSVRAYPLRATED